MRRRMLLGVGVLVITGLGTSAAQEAGPPSRYGVFLNPRLYPQGAPKETLASVVAALDRGRIDYVLAQLTEPAFVDDRVARFYRGDFDQLVGEASVKLADDPSVTRQLARFLKEGDWQETETTATARLKDVPDRQVYLRQIGARWYLQNRQK
jgi:hypothetical protein